MKTSLDDAVGLINTRLRNFIDSSFHINTFIQHYVNGVLSWCSVAMVPQHTDYETSEKTLPNNIIKSMMSSCNSGFWNNVVKHIRTNNKTAYN